MRLAVRGVLFFVLVLSGGLSAQERLNITLQANESAPYWVEKDSCSGMGCEILKAISHEAGIDTTIEFRPLKRLIADTSNNDLGNPLFYMNNQSFAAVIPIAVTYTAFFSYLPHTQECRLPQKECSKRHIGALKGTISNPASLSGFGEFEESYSHESLFKKLHKGRLDLVLELDLVGNRTIRSLFPNETDKFGIQVIPETVSPIAIMIDSSTPNALQIGRRYQEGLHRIIRNGTYQKILDKYYTALPVPSDWYNHLTQFEQIYSFESVQERR
ncbi:MAG: transporter substrate-binding domain-containing protein [Sulfuricurvum sp.]|nr:transporter substrate-binding domain-containing protein [Sulfuricurvum sp.]